MIRVPNCTVQLLTFICASASEVKKKKEEEEKLFLNNRYKCILELIVLKMVVFHLDVLYSPSTCAKKPR